MKVKGNISMKNKPGMEISVKKIHRNEDNYEV